MQFPSRQPGHQYWIFLNTLIRSCQAKQMTLMALIMQITQQMIQWSDSFWIKLDPGGVYPSTNFANQCQNPRSNSYYQDLIGTYEDENNWIRSWSHETYLWYSELPDINPSTVVNPTEYFEQMKTTAITNNGLPKDRFHYAENTAEYNQYTETGISAGYGFDLYMSAKEHLPEKQSLSTLKLIALLIMWVFNVGQKL